jgi:hypothetical protein
MRLLLDPSIHLDAYRTTLCAYTLLLRSFHVIIPACFGLIISKISTYIQRLVNNKCNGPVDDSISFIYLDGFESHF